MEMWLCMKHALNAADRYRERFKDSRAIQDADRLVEENAKKIAELSLKLAIAQRVMVEAQEAKVTAEVTMGTIEWSHIVEV
ncbi:unnamed protein product [Prunus armeniaca]